MKKLIVFGALLLLSSQVVQASSSLEDEFKNTFFTHYNKRFCGPNIVNFLKRAQDKGIDLTNANHIVIKNVGWSTFGMVNAEWVRLSGNPNPKPPGERNWYHHVILEVDGRIYDFSFDNEPQVPSVRDYINKMFLEERPKSEGGLFFPDSESKLKDYVFTVRSGLEVLSAQNDEIEFPKGREMKMEEFIKQF